MKDMCTISIIDEMIKNGVDSFKIEGRMKKPEYAAGVTSIYRKYIDKFYNGESTGVSEEDLRFLSKLYIRAERQEGYYHKHNGKDMITITKPGYVGADDEIIKFIEDKYINIKPTLPISINAYVELSRPLRIELKYNDISVQAKGSIVSEAINAPMDSLKIQKQLLKLGDTHFRCENVNIICDDNIFVSIKELNELRREGIKKLEEEIIKWNMEYILRY